jgi:predicted acetylornithine/succinylornithine family transaminase
MTNFEKMKKASDRVFFPTYNRFSAAIVRGKGAYVYDSTGKRYLDFLSGIGVTGLGHAHPGIIEAICNQARNLVHISNLYFMPPQTELAVELTALAGLERIFFCNSGAEANEAAIKLARKYSNTTHGEGRTEIITLEGSFHGRTLATAAATGQPKVKNGFEPLPEGFFHVPPGDFEALNAAVSDKTCAIMLEPILGEGGVVVLPDTFLQKVRELCDERDILLIMDEIQAGMGRTGRPFAHQWAGITPDIMTLAKALGGGLPMGAMLAREKYAPILSAGSHGTTFGGNPVACSTGLVVLAHLKDEAFLENIRKMGDMIRTGLNSLKARFPFIETIHGRGLMIGMALSTPCGDMVQKAFEKGLLINCTRESVLRMLPPLIISEKEVNEMLEIVTSVFEDEI